ncbi:MAG: DUF302 domain-containing protein [Paracoccaceae bacterium]
MRNISLFMALSLSLTGTAFAEDIATTYAFDGDFDDATFSVESAIIDRGLVIDYVSHTGEMLARTAADVGSDTKLFDAADVFMFCSAVLSRKMMEINALNVAYCPYSIFVTDIDGEVAIGYRNYPEGEMKEVQSLLDAITLEAVGN